MNEPAYTIEPGLERPELPPAARVLVSPTYPNRVARLDETANKCAARSEVEEEHLEYMGTVEK